MLDEPQNSALSPQSFSVCGILHSQLSIHHSKRPCRQKFLVHTNRAVAGAEKPPQRKAGRVAEWSKAPDSKYLHKFSPQFPSVGQGRTGLPISSFTLWTILVKLGDFGHGFQRAVWNRSMERWNERLATLASLTWDIFMFKFIARSPCVCVYFGPMEKPVILKVPKSPKL
jgi:hypothetical protein